MTTSVAKDVLRHVKAACRAERAYTLSAYRAPVKLNQNENPFDFPEALKRRVLEQALARPWSRYPDFDPRELREALASAAGWQPEGVLLGNGSNELIEALLLVTVGEGTPVVIPEPSFALYPLMTRLLGGRAVRVPLTAELTYDGQALLEARRAHQAPVTIVCSPNNPTGNVLAERDLRALLADSDGLVFLDEAYHEFAGASAVALLREFDNLVILRTFSKALGLAGLRIGYLLAAPTLTVEVDKARLPYNLNFFSQAAALAALGEPQLLRERVELLVSERERVQTALGTLSGVRPYPSQANFILFALERLAPRAAFEALHAAGVLVRDVSSQPQLGRCLRVTIGSPVENDRFLAELAALVEGRS